MQIKELEKKVFGLQADLDKTVKISGEKLDAKKLEVENVLQNQKESLELVKELQKQVQYLQESQATCEQKKKDLQETLERKNREIELLKHSTEQSRFKVEEAVQIVEYALLEKDAALLKETQAKEELTNLSNAVSKMTTEFEEAFAKRTNSIIKEYEEKFKNQHLEHSKVLDDLKNTKFELEKCNLKCKSFEREISILQKGDTQTKESGMSKLLILEKNLESTFQKLVKYLVIKFKR